MNQIQDMMTYVRCTLGEDASIDHISKWLEMLLLAVVDMKNKVLQLRND